MSVFQSDFVLRLPAYLYVCATVFSADGASAEFSITPYLVNRVRGLALAYVFCFVICSKDGSLSRLQRRWR